MLGPAFPRPPAPDPPSYGSVAWTPNGTRLLTAPTGTELRVWNAKTMTIERTIPTPRGPMDIQHLLGEEFVHGWAREVTAFGADRLMRLSDGAGVNLLIGAPPTPQSELRRCGGVVVADNNEYDGDEAMISHLNFRADKGKPLSAVSLNQLRRSGLLADFAAGKPIATR